MANKEIKRPYVYFPSNASTEVAGSGHLIKFKNYVVLLDCGIVQGHDISTNYQLTRDFLKKIKPTQIQYIILSHLHSDHSGLIPAIFAMKGQPHVYVPKGSLPFLRLLWQDSMKIFTADCQKLNRTSSIKATPFYSQEDIEIALDRCIEVDFRAPYVVNENIQFEYYSAGHIVNSAQVLLTLKDGYKTTRIGFTGDIGGSKSVDTFVENREILPFCDLLISENTYNSPMRPNKPTDHAKDKAKLQSIVQDYNTVILASFALERTQVLLRLLYSMWAQGELPNDIQVYLDSPLATKFCNLWDWGDENPMEWKNLHVIGDYKQSQETIKKHPKGIVIASSGFLAGGRILGWLQYCLPNRNDHLLFCGYSGTNNLASQIKDPKNRRVTIDGVSVPNNINITELRSFSSHADYDDLTDYLINKTRCNKLALVHGQQDDKVEYAKHLQDKMISEGKSTRVICVNKEQKIYL